MCDLAFEEKSRKLNSFATHDFYCKRRPEDYSNKIVCENFFKRRASVRQSRRLVLLASQPLPSLGGTPCASGMIARATTVTTVHHGSSSCQLNSGGDHNKIKHVIYIQFDNTHFRRDNPNVPSDLRTDAVTCSTSSVTTGTLLTNDHTVLISAYRRWYSRRR